MNKLIITANPSIKGFTHRIAEQYKNLSLKANDNVEILDLYKSELRQDFLTYERKRDIWKDDLTKKIQEKIIWADKIILIFPIWWADTPAIMKNFFDSNFTAWFAYRRDWRKLIGLLTNKRAEIYCTCWAPSFIYKIFPINLRIMWWWMRLNTCGIRLDKITVFWNIEQKAEEQKELLIKSIRI